MTYRSEGSLWYYDKLSDALGWVKYRIPSLDPEQIPVHVYDLVRGHRITIQFAPPELGPEEGGGTVYLADDGTAIKIGWTHGSVGTRLASLQTGNPRQISPIGWIADASEQIEWDLHAQLGEHRLRPTGEWFDRHSLQEAWRASGGIEPWLRTLLPPGDWRFGGLGD